MREPSDVVLVEHDDWEAVAGLVDEVWSAGTAEWVNVIPDLGDDVDTPPSLVRIFSSRGPAVPVVTLVAPDRRGRKPRPGSVGIEHGAGDRVSARLAEAGLTRPGGWVLRQDHPKRGLVFEVSDEVPGAAALGHGVAVARWLSPSPPRGRWLVALHRRPG